jgi:hypothetical protein
MPNDDMTFDEQLSNLIKHLQLDGAPHEEIEAAVASLYRQHGKEPPPPITGMVNGIDLSDNFGD